MDIKLVDRWLTALRSGKYQQTQTRLRNYNSYCCLGVLCDLESPARWRRITPTKRRCTIYTWNNGEEIFTAFPPQALLEKVGLSASATLQIARANDEGHTFTEIADMIERQLGL